jgi:hypothetical protein
MNLFQSMASKKNLNTNTSQKKFATIATSAPAGVVDELRQSFGANNKGSVLRAEFEQGETLTPELCTLVEKWLHGHDEKTGPSCTTIAKAEFQHYLQHAKAGGDDTEEEPRPEGPPLPLGARRQTPTFWKQTGIFARQAYIKQTRIPGQLAIDLGLQAFAATAMGALFGRSLNLTDKSLFDNGMLVVLFFGTLATLGSLRTYGEGRLMFFRQASVGCDTMAFYVGSMVVDLPMTLLRPCFYFCVYYSLDSTLSGLASILWLGWALSYCCSGWGYVLSLSAPASNRVLISVLITILMGTFLSGTKPMMTHCPKPITPELLHECTTVNPVRYITSISYARWGLEYYVCTILNFLPDSRSVGTHFLTTYSGFCTVTDDAFTLGSNAIYMLPLAILVIQGVILRLIAAFLLVWTCRDQQIRPGLRASIAACFGAGRKDVKANTSIPLADTPTSVRGTSEAVV